MSSTECGQLMEAAAELRVLSGIDLVQRRVAEWLLDLVPAEFAACHCWRAQERVVTPCYYPTPVDLPAAHRSFIPLAMQHPLTPLLFKSHSRAWKLTDVLSLAAFRRTAFFEFLYRPLGINRELTAAVPLKHHGATFLICSVHRQRRDFSERDRRVLNLLLPHVARTERPCKPFAASPPPQRLGLPELRLAISAQTEWRLKPREVEVLYWLSRGKSNTEIALLLGISPRTAETHALRAYPRMGVENRYAAIVTLLELEREVLVELQSSSSRKTGSSKQ